MAVAITVNHQLDRPSRAVVNDYAQRPRGINQLGSRNSVRAQGLSLSATSGNGEPAGEALGFAKPASAGGWWGHATIKLWCTAHSLVAGRGARPILVRPGIERSSRLTG